MAVLLARWSLAVKNAAVTTGSGQRLQIPPYVPPLPPYDEALFETLPKGINFDKYDTIPVECTGRDAPRHGLTRSVLFLFCV